MKTKTLGMELPENVKKTLLMNDTKLFLRVYFSDDKRVIKIEYCDIKVCVESTKKCKSKINFPKFFRLILTKK